MAKKYFILTVVPNGFRMNGKNFILRLSVSLDICTENLVKTGDNDEAYKTEFEVFYSKFLGLAKTFNKKNIILFKNKDELPLDKVASASFEKDENSWNIGKKTDMKNLIWERLFSLDEKKEKLYSKTVSKHAHVEAGTKISPGHLDEKLTYLNAEVGTDSLKEVLSQANKLAEINHEKTIAQKRKFIKTISLEMYKGKTNSKISTASLPLPQNVMKKKEIFNDFYNAEEIILADYLAEYIDPEEFVNTFHILSANPILKRMTGLMVDVEVDLGQDIKPDEKFLFRAEIKDNKNNKDNWHFFSTRVKCVKLGSKYAFLIDDSGSPTASYYNNTVLNMKTDTELSLFDKVSQNENLSAQAEKKKNNQPVSDSEKLDSFTRGIIMNHKKLNSIITSVDYPRHSDGSINDLVALNESFFASGHRVAVARKKMGESSFGRYSSITSRNVKIYKDIGTFPGQTDKPEFHLPVMESGINFDAVMNTTSDDGSPVYLTSGAMFEWSGQQLNLKSAFSKTNMVKKSDLKKEAMENSHDTGVRKSEIRSKQHLFVDVYPFRKLEENKAEIKLYYGLPEIKRNEACQLRFGYSYSFLVHHEYKNGWGLPLYSLPESLQLSVTDLAQINPELVSEEINFFPLENKKPVILYHTREVKEGEADKIKDKESLEHLIIRSASYDIHNTYVSERHLLPARISMEHAFWSNLLSKIPLKETIEWKTKYNCSFKHKDDFYNAKECPEGCKKYCGGTAMEKHYEQAVIMPNYLADPSVSGFKIKLFWDEKCSKSLNLSEASYSFRGTAGLRPESCKLRVVNSDDITTFENADQNRVKLNLKKGSEIYAQIYNILDNNGIEHISKSWVNLKGAGRHYSDAKLQVNDNTKNPPKTIKLSHAVKKPLLVPSITKLFYKPKNDKLFSISHVEDYLNKEYPHYNLNTNVFAERVTPSGKLSPLGSSIVRIRMIAHFERLDAMDQLNFVENITPTGSLELWMRKEDFHDDPSQYIDDPENYTPDMPIVSFEDQTNNFGLDIAINFDDNVMSQIKNANNVALITGKKNNFIDIMTGLDLTHDLRETKFEEREYVLRSKSKFEGFFDKDDPEKFVLPEMKDILKSDFKLRFRVLVLNNNRPQKPELSHMMTTIKENKAYPDLYSTTSRQQGNIITVYLKRNRFSSGKGERVGLIVDEQGIYSNVFRSAGLISKAARDILTDKYEGERVLLKEKNILPGKPKYNRGYDSNLGIVYFTPEFDAEKQLWKFEVELDVKTKSGRSLHNPFVNLCMVNFQPYSINYNAPAISYSIDDLKNDCRISEINHAPWSYLLPERSVAVTIHEPIYGIESYGSVRLTLGYGKESLNYLKVAAGSHKMQTNFIVTMEVQVNYNEWQPVLSRIKGKSTWQKHHALLDESAVDKDIAELNLDFEKGPTEDHKHFRLQIVEVEWFSGETWSELEKEKILANSILNNEKMRVRYIELIYSRDDR